MNRCSAESLAARWRSDAIPLTFITYSRARPVRDTCGYRIQGTDRPHPVSLWADHGGAASLTALPPLAA